MTTALDRAERRRRELVSATRRLRVAATSDASRGVELADTLVSLTGSRLLGWDFAEAAADAPESVLLAARILAGGGPVGPYAALADAVRYFTASAQLAAVQAGLGQAEAAGRTLTALDAWRRQLGRLPLLEHLEPAPAVWALVARSRSLLGVDVAAANTAADAALVRLYAAGLERDAESAYLAVAAHLAAADARWAAGGAGPALGHHRLALARHAAVAGHVRQVRPAVARAVLAPVPALYERFAERLESAGQAAPALAVRREQLDLVERLAGSTATAPARAGLALALARAGRDGEAAELAEGAGPAGASPVAAPAAPTAAGETLDWPQPSAEDLLATQAPPPEATARLRHDEGWAAADLAAAGARAEADEARRIEEFARLAAERAAGEQAAARRAAEAAERARQEAAEQASRRAAAAAARKAEEEAAARAAAAARRRELAEARGASGPGVDADTIRAAAGLLESARAQVAAAGSELVLLAEAQERLAGLLRPLAVAEPAEHGPELLAALEALVGLRWRLGDADGSREAAREARALAGRLDR